MISASIVLKEKATRNALNVRMRYIGFGGHQTKRKTMKPIESFPDKDHCEMCGALKTENGIDPAPNRSGAEVIRRLAFIAETSPSLAILLIHHIAGRTEREIAVKLKITHQAIHGRIARAQKTMLAICKS
jgi:hypothetical protein